MLSILLLTYLDMPVEDLLRGGVPPTRQQVFEYYVDRMLTRRGGDERYRPEQTKKWLTWLAQHRQQKLGEIFPGWGSIQGSRYFTRFFDVSFPASIYA
jgi:eukaryotic-like serine/threonine-protein kinase